ncbi:hypothetical protein HPP92_009129 [Vanilla planifolia]|uniref:Uncharacterized protein n=1 Tax=Vanilla planifolia TaxID=51239 RepID=A0A835V611_VANPL|nr:hypothetical protein HPP92_009129 [Vanilla planifolia]
MASKLVKPVLHEIQFVGGKKCDFDLSAVGLPNVGEHFETWNAGVLGPATLSGLNEGQRYLTWQKWTYQIGLKGEALSLHTLSGSSSAQWEKHIKTAAYLEIAVHVITEGEFNETKCQSNCGEPSKMVNGVVDISNCLLKTLQPSVVHWRNKGYNNSKVHLSCEPGKKMTNIKFASFGIPKDVFETDDKKLEMGSLKEERDNS